MTNEIKAGANTAGGLLIWQITLNDWVGILTVVYLSLQTLLLLSKFIRWWRELKHSIQPKEKHDDQ